MKTASNNAIFSIPIEGPAWPEIERSLRTHAEGSAFWIVTANPEILLAANADPAYVDTLRQADLRTVDGVGLFLALRLKGQRVVRLAGVELAEHLLAYADKAGLRVALIGGPPGVSALALKGVQKRYPTLVMMAEQGGRIARDGVMDEQGESACERLTLFAPQVLFVAFGHPRQERWIARYVHDFPTVRVVVGVGGTVDFWAGTIRRAPVWMRNMGLEWLWRLIQEPRRLGRIGRAVIVFPWHVLMSTIRNHSK